MADRESVPAVRQYFEHPPRSHLYQGSPTASSPVYASSPIVPSAGQCAEAPHDASAGPSAPTPGDNGVSVPQAGSPDSAPQPRRTLSTVLLTGLMYTFTISGAYGIEESVMGGGVMLTILSILIIPIIMGGPTALVVAELAAAVPSNAGFLMWIKLSFHRTVYLAMAILSVIYIATDNALYPTLFSEYVCTAVECSTAGSVALRLGMLAVTFLLNVLGVETVGIASVVLTILTVLPFVLIFLRQQLTSQFYINWPAVVYVPTESISWATFISTASWCLSGLEQAGTVVEDIKDPQRTIVGSLIPLMGLAFITYIPPILSGASISRDPIDLSEWTTGYWSKVAFEVGGPTLQLITVAGGILSAFGLTLSAICTTTRILSGMALTEAFPGKFGEWLSFRSTRYGTYPWTLTLNTALTALFSTVLSFGALVKIDQCLYGIRVITIFVSFYRIRHLYPHLARPFRVPLEGWKLHVMMGVSTASFAVLTVVAALEWVTAVLCVAVIAASFLAAYVYCHYYRRHDFLGRVVTEYVVETSATDSAADPASNPEPTAQQHAAKRPE